jgi:hypothetical protein
MHGTDLNAGNYYLLYTVIGFRLLFTYYDLHYANKLLDLLLFTDLTLTSVLCITIYR